MRARISAASFACLLAVSVGAPHGALAAPPVEQPAFSWTGVTVGLDVGYAWAQASGNDCNWARTTCPAYSTGADGILGGVYVAFNWQVDHIVLGIEGDIEGSAVTGTSTFSSPFASYLFGHEVDENWQGSLRARLGYAFDRTLVYVTGGVAYADVFNNVWRLGKSFHAYGETRPGWTVGAGVEQALSDHFTARLEYRYTGFDSSENSVGTNSTLLQDLNQQAVRMGIGYKF
ncbi:outer membrane protein [Xanthobacter flavus]|uniref:outer membrane protein n=1 Tax=Xanthobacter flavus TaxID=281 RepID=UPI00372A4D2A